MLTNKNMQERIGLVLLLGTCISVGIALIGSTLYLIQHGSEIISVPMLQSSTYDLSVVQILDATKLLSPIGIIEFGLLALVITQIIRVITLVWFYLKANDYIFTGINLFILLILLYSLFRV